MRGLAFRRLHGRRARQRALRRLRWLFTSDPKRVDFKILDRLHADRTSCACSMCGVPHESPATGRGAPDSSARPDVRIGFLRITLL